MMEGLASRLSSVLPPQPKQQAHQQPRQGDGTKVEGGDTEASLEDGDRPLIPPKFRLDEDEDDDDEIQLKKPVEEETHTMANVLPGSAFVETARILHTLIHRGSAFALVVILSIMSDSLTLLRS
jgi:hypothetical protein